jgi:transcriptional regulator with XRE-family HTH domain
VRQRREALGLTQKAAAEQARISRVEWNQMETGRRGIGPVNAARIAGVIGGEPAEYLTRPQRPDEIRELRERLAALEREVQELRRRGAPSNVVSRDLIC